VGLLNKILARNRRGRASGSFLESAELSGRLKVIVPTSQFAWQGLEVNSDRVNVPRRGALRIRWRPIKFGRACGCVPGEEIEFRLLPGNQFRGRGINTGEPIFTIGLIEMVVPDNHGMRNKCIDPQALDLVPQFGCIKGSSDIRPVRYADQPFVTVTQLLPSDLGDKGKDFLISDLNKDLVQIRRVQVGIRIWLMPKTTTVPAFCIEIQPGRWI